MAVNLASKYSKNVSEKFARESFTSAIGSANYDFVGVDAVNVYSVATADMNNYSRTGTSRYGTPSELQDTVQTLTLTQDRAFTFTIDRGNYNDQMMVKEAGKSLARQIREKVIPEMDVYRLAKVSHRTLVNGNFKESNSDKTTAYADFLALNEKLDNEDVTPVGRKFYCRASFFNLLKQDSAFVLATPKGQDIKITGLMGEVDGVDIIKVPGKDLTTGINGVLVHPSAVCSPVKLKEYKINNNPQGVSGWLIEGRVIYDCFVMDAKSKGTAVLVDTAPVLATASTAGTAATNGTFLTYTLPEGTVAADFTKVEYKVASSAITLPDIGSAWTGGTTYVATEIAASTNTHYCIALLDAADKVVFAGTGTLVKKV